LKFAAIDFQKIQRYWKISNAVIVMIECVKYECSYKGLGSSRVWFSIEFLWLNWENKV